MTDEPQPSLASAIPGLVRVVASGLIRTTQWATTTSLTTLDTMVKAVAAGESPSHALADAAIETRDAVRGLLGIEPPPAPEAHRAATAEELRARGARLLYDSADVFYEDRIHPAFERILDELSPDEARILRLLAIEGPQPSLDVRTHRPLGVGSELVASGLSMIGLHAGVRNIERTRSELNNLERLGLVWFSREEVADPSKYQVVEVQPDVQTAMKSAGRSPRTVHRSIHLTPFGEDFCRVCLPIDGLAERRPPATNGDHP